MFGRSYTDKETASAYRSQQYTNPYPAAELNLTDRLATIFASYNSSTYATPTPISSAISNNCSLSEATPDTEEMLFLELLNQYRQQNGKAALTMNTKLTDAAKWMSNDMASKNRFEHTDSQGRSPFDRLRAWSYRYSAAAENISASSATASTALQNWKNSPAHNINMLGNYAEIGIGRACGSDSSYRWYWTTKFGTSF